MNRRIKGFTLVELLVVIAIIGILSAIVLASMSGARMKGRDAKRVADLKQLQLALQLYYEVNDSYPSTAGNVDSVLLTPLTSTSYISVIPRDPLPTTYHYAYLPLPSGCSSACNDYVLAAQLETSNSTLDPYISPQAITLNTVATDCNTFAADKVFCVKP